MEQNTNHLSGSRILVVDDDLSTRLTSVKVLQKEGYSVAHAADGQEALKLLQNTPMPDLILLDVVMPEVDGFEVCERVRLLDTRIPVIMLTGLDDVTAIDRAFSAGATDFITKPINWALLVRRVRYALRTYSMTRALDHVRIMQSEAQEVARLGFFEWNPQIDQLSDFAGISEIFHVPVSSSADGIEGYLRHVDRSDQTYVRQQLNLLQSSVEERVTYSHGFMAGDGERHVRAIARKISATSILCVLQDITDFWNARQTVEFQQHHDNLTRLPNRSSFHAELEHVLETSDQCAVLTLDILRFHMINDSFGQVEGDKLLQLFSLRLQAATQGLYPMARLGADEFAVLIPDSDDLALLESWVVELQQRLGGAYDIGGQPVFVETTIGISQAPEHGVQASQLISTSIQARLVAKRQGKRFKIYDESCQEDYARRLYLESELRHALERHQFRLLYQPQLDLMTNRIVGVEALIRWEHPDMGLVSPVEFIPIAENMELIHSLGYWVAEEAIRQAKQWHIADQPLRVGINLSGRQFGDVLLADKLKRMLAEAGLPAELLDLEITESTAMENPERALALVAELKALGVTLAIDDFGTGYSSLEYLQKYAVDFIKIDRAFVKNLVHNPADQGIVKAVLGIAESLDMRVIAEGVETAEELALLKQLCCHEIQGYFISKPVPASEIPVLLSQYNQTD